MIAPGTAFHHSDGISWVSSHLDSFPGPHRIFSFLLRPLGGTGKLLHCPHWLKRLFWNLKLDIKCSIMVVFLVTPQGPDVTYFVRVPCVPNCETSSSISRLRSWSVMFLEL